MCFASAIGGIQMSQVAFQYLSLNVPATMVVVMVVHVLHRDPAPSADHKCFNLTLVFPAGDAEVAVLSPVLSPGVGSDLKTKHSDKVTARSERFSFKRVLLTFAILMRS